MGMLLRRAAFLVCCLAAQGGSASAQVLNMSHDLVTLGIAQQNLAPNNPSLDARPLFQAAIQYIQNHPGQIQTLTLDTGAYYLLTQEQSNAVLVFPVLTNLTIDLAGSTIYFKGPLLPDGLLIYYCTNVTLKNFNTDYLNPPYTHVQLASVDTVNRLLHYQTLAGWPDPSSFNNLVDPSGGQIQFWGAIFRNGQMLPATNRMALSLPINNDTLTLTQDQTPWTQSATLATFQPGDTVVVMARAGGSPIDVWSSDSITLSDIKVYGSNDWAVTLYEAANSVVDHVSVMPRPLTGLVGSNADGIHFTSVYQNNHIRNSYVARTMDDALAMDNQFHATVVSVNGPRQITVTRSNFDRFPNGTAVNFVDPVSTIEFAGATIISQNPPDSMSPGDFQQVMLSFDRNLPTLTAGEGMVFASPSMRGQGSTVEDNLVEDPIGHGVWINGAIGVTVQRNVIRRTSVAGIAVAQDTESFPAPPAQNVTITDNALEADLGPTANSTGAQDSLASVQVVSTNNQSFSFASSPSNANISILNNYIADSGRSGIWIGELNGGVLQNNLIVRWDQHPELPVWGIPGQFLTQVLQDFASPIVTHYSSAVTELNNTTAATSPITAPVTMTPASAAWPAAGGAGSFSLQTAVSGFGWNAVSDSPWLTVTSPVPGAGSGTMQYSVSPNNTGAPRNGNITIAGVTFPVLQTTFTTPVLAVTKTHTGSFTFGQMGATYTLTLSNHAGAVPTSGVVTVSDTVPAGLTLVSMAGSGWTCTGPSCNRSDSLAGGESYPPITVTVNVAANASSPQVNQANVSGGGSATANASDSTIIVKSGGDCVQLQQGTIRLLRPADHRHADGRAELQPVGSDQLDGVVESIEHHGESDLGDGQRTASDHGRSGSQRDHHRDYAGRD
jgi:uncharacterized repeat protein (TIGR01451 family)